MKWEYIVQLEKEGRLPELGSGPPKYEDDYILAHHLSVSDTHGRWVDRRAWDALLGFMEDYEFDSFTGNGDWMDFYELSRYEKDPDVERSVNDDFIACEQQIMDIRHRHSGRIVLNPGNHEERYERYLRGEAKKLSDFKPLKIQERLDLDHHGVEWMGADGYELTPECRVYHGEVVRAQPGQSARGELEAWGTSGTSGHVHRLAVYNAPGKGDRSWAESGCLCSLRPEYSTKPVNWQHGWVIIHELASGKVLFETVRVLDGHVIRL